MKHEGYKFEEFGAGFSYNPSAEAEKMHDEFHEFFAELVPESGKAESLAGEMLRAIGHLYSRWTNMGYRVSRGEGHDECDPAARFLKKYGDKNVKNLIVKLRRFGREQDEEEYILCLEDIAEAVLAQVKGNPELRTTETEDMWDTK